MPLKAWRRAVVYTLAGLIPLLLLVRAALLAQGPARAGWLLAAFLVLAAALFLCWLYLPDVDLPGRTVRRGPVGAGRIAITFDDGPNGPHTERVLDVLQKHGARATFFCIGEAARRYPHLVRRMAAEGHAVGNHTFGHKLLPWCPQAEVERQLRATQEAIAAAGVQPPRIFRAPKGWKNRHLPGVLRALGLQLIGWTHGVWDTDRPGVEVIVARARKCLADGKILLLHDGLPGMDRSQTAEALDRILAECAARGLRPVTIPELLDTDAAAERRVAAR